MSIIALQNALFKDTSTTSNVTSMYNTVA